MAFKSCEISEYTGSEFKECLTKLIKDERVWKGGKIYEFTYKLGEREHKLFQIKAMKKQNPIEELITFSDEGDDGSEEPAFISWEKARPYMELQGFGGYYEQYEKTKLRAFKDDVVDKVRELEICFMLSFEIARCTICSKEVLVEAIEYALNSENEDDLIDLCKVFPKKELSRIEEERRKYALDCIIKRKKMKYIKQINNIWPRGEDPDAVLEMFSDKSIERKYAFDKFLERKKKYESVLLSQEVVLLEYFKTILTTNDEKDARRAFKKIDKKLREKYPEESDETDS